MAFLFDWISGRAVLYRIGGGALLSAARRSEEKLSKAYVLFHVGFLNPSEQKYELRVQITEGRLGFRRKWTVVLGSLGE